MEVSVIIPAYNAAAFLERAVESALQHPEVQEILLVEDGSNDTTFEICTQLADKYLKVRVFQHPKGQNQGAGASRNLGIKNATQEFIAFLDADDYYTDIRFQKEKEVFKNNPDADGVYGAIGVEYLDAIGAKAWEKKGLDATSLTSVHSVIPHNNLFEFLIGYNNLGNYEGYFSIDGFTVKREALQMSGVWFNPSLRLHQDTVFLWQLSYYLKLYTGEYKSPVAMRGVHGQNRFIHKTNLYVSRYKQYSVLRDWSLQEKLDIGITKRFHLRYFRNYLRSKNRRMRVFYYVKLLFKDAYTFKVFNKKQLKIVKELMFSKERTL